MAQLKNIVRSKILRDFQLIKNPTKINLIIFNSPAFNGNSVFELISECLRRVIDDDCLGKVSSQDIEVLDVVAVDADAVLAEQTILDVLPVGVQEIQQLVGVNFLGGGEQGDFVLG